ncbi:Rho GTPase activation protein [Lactarius sanguifluus]|nr:Rho GTPase activation protein [Lactarius sanguifluus]
MSFISVEPQPRAISESHSNSLLAQFGTQLQIIADRYLAFFQERRTIEATYIDSLRKLHRKAKTIDTAFDPRAEPTTTRAAWDTVRDNLEGEASTQQAFVDILDNDIIKPLKKLKKTEDWTGKRIEDDLEESAAEYANHAETRVSTLQKTYLKRYHPRRPGDKGSAPSRDWRESTMSDEVFDNDCRRAVGQLNALRSTRVKNLEDGYDCLEKLVFTPTVKDVLAKYMDGMITVRAKCDNLAKSTGAEVKKALAGTDNPDLRASFRRALSFSIPPLTLYCNYRPGVYSDLVFCDPLVALTTDQDNVQKVMRMCIEEVEKRGLNTHKIYTLDAIYDAEALQLRHRLESEKSFSFNSTDNIRSVAALLARYLCNLPEPLFMFSLQDYRNYGQNRARYNDLSLLRTKIRELHPVQRASLGALCQHLLRVAFHSNKNAMTVNALAAELCYDVLRGDVVRHDGVDLKNLVMEDLIQNAYTLFDERPPSSPIFSPDVVETMSTFARYPESPRPVEPTTGHLSTSTRSSFSTPPSDTQVEMGLTPTDLTKSPSRTSVVTDADWWQL